MLKLRSLVIFVAAIAVGLVPLTNSAAAPTGPRRLTLAYGAIPTTGDPAYDTNALAMDAYDAVFDTIIPKSREIPEASAMGQSVIVENRPGAGGTVGAELGVKAVADGYTLTLIAPSYTVGPSMYKLTFDAANDITAIIQLSRGAFLLAVHPSLPVKNVKELIALAKARPGQISFASGGAGRPYQGRSA